MYNNPYYNPYQNRYVPVEQQVNRQIGLQGKSVDSIEVVKATDVPFDGSISYFPLTDGSAILTKQLQNDGTSKITIFKPFKEQKNEITYITREQLEKSLDDLNLGDIDDIKEDIKEIKKKLKEFKLKKDE